MEIKELKSSALFLAWPWEIIFNFLLSSRSVILLEKLSNSRLEIHNRNKYILTLFLKIRFSFKFLKKIWKIIRFLLLKISVQKDPKGKNGLNFLDFFAKSSPKGVKDEVKQARRVQSRPKEPLPRSWARRGPKTSSMWFLWRSGEKRGSEKQEEKCDEQRQGQRRRWWMRRRWRRRWWRAGGANWLATKLNVSPTHSALTHSHSQLPLFSTFSEL